MELNEYLNQRRTCINSLRTFGLSFVNTLADLAILQFCEIADLPRHEESSVPEMAPAIVMTKAATTGQLRDLRKRQKFLQQMLDAKTT